VVALLTDAGEMVEWVKHSAYGVPFALPAGDTDSDGDWDATDSNTILGGGAYDVRRDADLDGDVDAADAAHAHSITGSYQTLGRGVLSSAGVSNRRGYAGYEYAPEFEGAGRHLYHVRHRIYDAGVGRWTRRDPLGYVDGMSLYGYVQGLAVVAADPWGLFICVGGCQPPTPAAGEAGVPVAAAVPAVDRAVRGGRVVADPAAPVGLADAAGVAFRGTSIRTGPIWTTCRWTIHVWGPGRGRARAGNWRVTSSIRHRLSATSSTWPAVWQHAWEPRRVTDWALGKTPIPGYRRPGRGGPPKWDPKPGIDFDPFNPSWRIIKPIDPCSLVAHLAGIAAC